MQTIETHKVNVCNEYVDILALDEPGDGGACHEYALRVSPMDEVQPHESQVDETLLKFQNGPIAEVGVNGITNESLLAVLIHRMEGFQSGPFASEYNEHALMHLQFAKESLLARTRDRETRGVEGTHKT